MHTNPVAQDLGTERTIGAPDTIGPSLEASQSGPTARPSIIVVDRQDHVGAVADEVHDRYGSAYAVHATTSPRAALSLLRRMAAGGDEVALVLAAHDFPRTTCTEILVAAHELHPIARRGLLLNRGEERSNPEYLTEAVARGHMDHFVTRPRRTADERFHRAVTSFLDDWWRQRGEGLDVVRVIGDPNDRRSHEICDLFTRNDVPHGFYSNTAEEGTALLASVGMANEPQPVAILDDGTVMINPTNREMGAALGARVDPSTEIYDVAIIGGGPAGLASAVYAASEGLRTAVLEHQALGGQAGTSSLIRNYLGFPRGISGAEFAARALEQAKILGADVIYGSEVTSLRRDGNTKIIGRADGSEVRARAVIVATGVSYQRLSVPSLERLIGRGVFYGAAVSEAKSLAGKRVYVVGGGNSAGQAALHLAKYAKQVTIVVRSESLASSMSNYLITELNSCPHIDIRYCTEVVNGGGDHHLEQLTLRNHRSNETTSEPADALVILIGGRPRTGWLPVEVRRDPWGYLLTGSDTDNGDGPQPQACSHLETTVAGVFAIGDVRHGSVKRVASAAGEGSVCVQHVHQYLATTSAIGEADTMRAVTQLAYGTSDTWHVVDTDKPAIQAKEVLVRVHAAGLDRGTWHLMTGRPYLMRIMGFGLRAPKNRVPGLAVAGTVVAVGKEVTRFSVGDEVFGVSRGAFAEYAAAREDKLSRKPSNVTFEQAAAVPISATTAHQAVHAGRLEAGQTVLVIGASGGVGTYAVQIAKAFGAEVTGVCSTAKTDLVRSLGADHVIDYTAEDFTDGSRRYDLILDVGGNTSLRQLRRALTPTGSLVLVGGENGGNWTGGFGRSLRAPLWSLVLRQRLTMLVSNERFAELEALTELIETGKVTPAIDGTYPLDQAEEAMRHLETGQVRGKVAITIQVADA